MYFCYKCFPTHFIKAIKPDINFQNVVASESIIAVNFTISRTSDQITIFNTLSLDTIVGIWQTCLKSYFSNQIDSQVRSISYCNRSKVARKYIWDLSFVIVLPEDTALDYASRHRH